MTTMSVRKQISIRTSVTRYRKTVRAQQRIFPDARGLYMKEIPEQVKAAVESLDVALCCNVHRPIN
jgi:hypothetical protein